MRQKPSIRQRNEDKVRKVLMTVLCFFLAGTMFVFKQDYHRQLSARLFAAQSDREKLVNRSSYIQTNFIRLTEHARIQKFAKEQLAMVPIEYVVDTIRVSTGQKAPDVSIASIFGLN